jgi:Pentapeptide repeats (8 copies)
LIGADLRGADFQDAHLEGADLTDATVDSITVWPDGFDPKRPRPHAGELAD